ncbi:MULTISPECIES: hypothetical protein [Flavobacterium]|uniref:Uncharacterized protein n=1 Tax=Flavobacterium hankyongi TaxID=1176532 RepID=A0ABP8ZZG3_9FLAO|nr:hypothetical protein [Flavobacterium sp. N1846]
MKLLLKFAIIIFSLNCFAQSKIDKMKDEVVKEGILLFKSEMASWYGSDILIEKIDRSKFGGYVSYTEEENTKCVFLSNDKVPQIIGMVTFDKTFDIKNAKTDLVERKPSEIESQLFELRTKSLEAISNDTIFKQYKNTNLNIVPIISKDSKKVYVLTGPTQNGVVLFGNDYLITFNRKENIDNIKKLHSSLIPVQYGGGDPDKKSVASMHSHLPEYSDIITATDICTTMLYQKFTEWESSYVMSKKYVSMWDCKKNDLIIMTIEAWEKISNQVDKK